MAYKKKEDLQYQGKFLTVTCDMAIMNPMIDMAGKDRVKYIKDITYLYRVHPRNVAKIYSTEQQAMDKYIRNMPPYKLLESR